MTTAHNAAQMQTAQFLAFPAAGAQSSTDNSRMKLRIDFMRTAGKVVLQLAGQLDETTVSQLEREATNWLNRGQKTLVLDMELIESLKQAGVRSIVTIGKLLEMAGGSLVLCGVYGLVRNVLAMYGVGNAFETFENLEEFENHSRCVVIQ